MKSDATTAFRDLPGGVLAECGTLHHQQHANTMAAEVRDCTDRASPAASLNATIAMAIGWTRAALHLTTPPTPDLRARAKSESVAALAV